MALMSQSMDGNSGSSNSSGGNRGTNMNRNSNVPLGINRQSSKIGKNVKRGGAAALPPPQPSKQPPPPPVYNINKNEFRNLVQRLTGSPLPERYDQPPPPRPPSAVPAHPPPAAAPKPPNSRLHKIRPPPLNAVGSGIAPAGAPAILRSPTPFGNSMSPFFSPPPPLTPGDPGWAGNAPMESPVTRYMRYLQDSMVGGGGGGLNPSPRGGPLPGPSSSQRPPPPPPFHAAHGHGYGHPQPQPPLLPSPRRPPPLPSPTSQFLLPSPLPSPGSFFALPSPGSPFPLNFFSQSPSGQFGFPGGGPSLPPSPGLMFPLLPSPTPGRFPGLSPRWRELPPPDFSREDFTFPDSDRRL